MNVGFSHHTVNLAADKIEQEKRLIFVLDPPKQDEPPKKKAKKEKKGKDKKVGKWAQQIIVWSESTYWL